MTVGERFRLLAVLFANAILAVSAVPSSIHLSESWAILSSDKPKIPQCVKIPQNLSMCYGLQYDQMRLPNLLEHETISEVIDNSKDFTSLVQLSCHADTQLFLCSLFAPICLPTMDKEILPCRSLCEAVKSGCEGRMRNYGFAWPDMLSCEKYPEDNDMCIKPVHNEKQGNTEARDISCPSCSQVGTYENLVDHFCRSHIVMKARLGEITRTHISVRNARSLKKGDRRRSIPDTEIRLSQSSMDCPCNFTEPEGRFLIMANKTGDGNLTANLIIPWKKDKNFKRAVHQFQRLNCKSLGREIRESASRRPHYYTMRKHNTGRYHLA